MPRDVIHPYGDVEHRDVHNMYGYYVHRATFEGLQKRTPGDRPFVLTRSFFIGSHKYSAIWTGDNTATWEHLKASIAMVGALTLGGQSLVGADVGGFFKHPSDELTTRWYQLAVLAYPFLRNHAHLETPRREPYVFQEATMNRIKTSLQMRYRMLPLWYTLFHEYHAKGAPVVRPLFWDFVHDPETHSNDVATEDQIMLGDVLLVHGVTKPIAEASETQVYLPQVAGGWYDVHSGSLYSSGAHTVPLTLDSIPSFYRSGVIVPLKSRIRRSSTCMRDDPLTLNVYVDTTLGAARGRVYIDDYKTQQYQDGSSYIDIDLVFENHTLRADSVRGSSAASADLDLPTAEVERVEVFGLAQPPAGASLTSNGVVYQLPVPRAREIAGSNGAKLYTAVIKMTKWIDLRKGTEWKLELK